MGRGRSCRKLELILDYGAWILFNLHGYCVVIQFVLVIGYHVYCILRSLRSLYVGSKVRPLDARST
jgi:hypothetical protein